jgi:hypothetical protein
LKTKGTRLAIPLIIAALLAAFTGILPGTTPVAKADTVTCTPYEILGARGSGQLPQPGSTATDTFAGFGQQAYAFATTFVSLAGLSSSDYSLWSVPYPAVPVAGIDGIPNAVTATLSWQVYSQAVQIGQTLLTDQINLIEQDCSSQTKIILVGFSQGAQVVGNVDISLTSAQLADIAGVAMFGDPLFNPASLSARGDFSLSRVGSLAHPLSLLRGAFPNPANVVSYCYGTDPVCQGFLSYNPFAIVTSVGSHLDYNTEGDASNSAPYTKQAAEALLSVIDPSVVQPAARSFAESAARTAARNVAEHSLAKTAAADTPDAPIDLTLTGFTATTETYSWSAPTSGPAALGYELYTAEGIPLGDVDSSTGGSLTLPLEAMPPDFVIQSANESGDGGTLTETIPGAEPNEAMTLDGAAVTQAATGGGGDYDFSTYAAAGQTITITGSLPAGSSGGYVLLDPNANVVVPDTSFSDAPGTDQTFIDSYAVTTSGVYTFYLSCSIPGTGSGTIAVQAAS